MSLATVAAVVGTVAGGASLYNQFRGGNTTGASGGGGSGQTYVPTGSGAADQSFQQMLQQMQGGASGVGGAVSPAIMQAFQRMMGIDTQPIADAGRNAGQYYGSLASSQDAYHNMLVDSAWRNYGGQGRLQGAGDSIWNTAQDPEGALRDRLAGQVQNTSRAATSARGIGMSPQAAGIESQDLSRFYQDWQDRQLGRQATGLQGMAGAYGMGNQLGASAGQDLTGASNFGTAAAQNIGQSAMTPFQMMMAAYGAPMQYAGQLTGAQAGVNNLYGNAMQQIIPYLYAGQGAAGQQYSQGQTGLNNFTTGLQQLGKSPMLANLWTPQPMNSQNTLGTNQNIFGNTGGDTPYG